MRASGVAALLALCASAAVARAQPAPYAEPGRFEVSLAAGWSSGYDLGSSRVNAPVGGGTATLFEAEAAIGGALLVSGRFAWRAWRILTLEGAVNLSRPQLRSTVRSDIEPALNATLDTPYYELAGEAGLVVPLRRATTSARLRPFVTGGGGYFRQTDEDGVLLETGAIGYGGGGVRWLPTSPRPDRFFKAIGLRGDLRLVVRTGGIDVEDRARAFVTLTGGAFVRF